MTQRLTGSLPSDGRHRALPPAASRPRPGCRRGGRRDRRGGRRVISHGELERGAGRPWGAYAVRDRLDHQGCHHLLLAEMADRRCGSDDPIRSIPRQRARGQPGRAADQLSTWPPTPPACHRWTLLPATDTAIPRAGGQARRWRSIPPSGVRFLGVGEADIGARYVTSNLRLGLLATCWRLRAASVRGAAAAARHGPLGLIDNRHHANGGQRSRFASRTDARLQPSPPCARCAPGAGAPGRRASCAEAKRDRWSSSA